MSDNIYNILNNFNKVAQEPQKPATQKQPTAKTQLQESMEQVLSRKLVAEKKAKPDYIDLDKDGNKKEPMKKAAKDAKKVEEGSTGDYSAKKGAAGKDLGKPGKNFSKIAKSAGKEYGSKERGEKVAGAVLAKLRAKESVNEMDKSQPSSDRGGESSGNPWAKGSKATPVKAKDMAKSAGKSLDKAMKQAKPVKEVAPPGEKAERMVKHIKKGYAKDGKITPKEKSIAYATAWKAHNKGKVEEAIKAMMEAGFTKEQIVEGWDEMMKSVKDRAHSMKTGEKRAGAKGEIEKTAGGVKHTRRYDPKTGETETGSDGEQVKRGRGRPKKSTFESKQLIKKMIAETFSGFFEGSIQGGVWTAKGGNVPAPTDPEMAAPTKMGTAAITPKTGISGQAAQDLMKSSDPNIYNKLTGQKTPAKLTPVVSDPEGVKEEVDELEESLNQMRRIAGLPVAEAKKAKKDYDGDGKVESGKDEYLGSKIAAAKKAGKLKEGEMCSKCDCDPCECDDDKKKVDECMSPISGAAQDMQDSQGKMNINTSMDSDGHKSVTITADGDAAGELMQMLKLAGMGGAQGGEEAHMHDEPEGVMVVSADEEGSDEEVEEAKDERYHANTTPEEEVMPVQQQTKGGNGDVAGQEKKMTKHGYQFGDNPQAMKESMSLKLIKEYEGIKVKK